MKKKKITAQDKIVFDLETFIGLVILIVVLLFLYPRYENHSILDSNMEYQKDIMYVDMEYNIKKAAIKTEALLSLMEYDKDVLVYEPEYIDYIIYGDDRYENPNDIEYKMRYLGLVLSEINSRSDDITISSSNKKETEQLWNEVNEYVRAINSSLNKYNALTKSELIHITSLKKELIKQE